MLTSSEEADVDASPSDTSTHTCTRSPRWNAPFSPSSVEPGPSATTTPFTDHTYRHVSGCRLTSPPFATATSKLSDRGACGAMVTEVSEGGVLRTEASAVATAVAPVGSTATTSHRSVDPGGSRSVTTNRTP
ncbi:MAG: hypothetical protein RLZZ383_2721 [Pseudomonadota bacterium]